MKKLLENILNAKTIKTCKTAHWWGFTLSIERMHGIDMSLLMLTQWAWRNYLQQS